MAIEVSLCHGCSPSLEPASSFLLFLSYAVPFDSYLPIWTTEQQRACACPFAGFRSRLSFVALGVRCRSFPFILTYKRCLLLVFQSFQPRVALWIFAANLTGMIKRHGILHQSRLLQLSMAEASQKRSASGSSPVPSKPLTNSMLSKSGMLITLRGTSLVLKYAQTMICKLSSCQHREILLFL